MNLSTTLQKFIASSETNIVNLTKQIESNQLDLDFRPCAFLEEQNEKYRNKIQFIQAEMKTAQDTLIILKK